MKSLSQHFNALINNINAHADRMANPYRIWGIFCVITYPLYYFIWHFLQSPGYENLTLRLIVVVQAIPLIFVDKWSPKLARYLPVYWYLHLLYSLPFLFTFLLLKNEFSALWVLNVTSLLTLSVLLIDWIALLIVFPLGILGGWLLFTAMGNVTHLSVDGIKIIDIAVVYTAIIVQGALFAHRKEAIRNERMQAMQTLSMNIAHELRTPLRSIGSGINGIRLYLPILLDAYVAAKKTKAKIPIISPKNFDLLQTTCDGMESEVNSAFTTIDVLLANVNHDALKNMEIGTCSIKACINEALERYPFDLEETELLRTDGIIDFKFNGNKTAMMHMLFNLLKNALYHIRASAKQDAKILIWTSSSKNHNYLHFKDTGSGINKKVLPHIFKRFYSLTRHGSGIGLSFCRYFMELIDGEISCQAAEGEYTEFIMQFPKIT